MAGLYDGIEEIKAETPALPAPKAPPSMYDGLELAPTTQQAPARTAVGAVESIQAGLQASAPGLAWRGKLPDLVMNPEHAKWWERALTGISQVAAELPIMAVGAAAGAPVGAAAGTAIAPGAGTAVGGVLGAGAGMFGVPAAIRESLVQAYKSGEVKTAADFWNILKEVAGTTAKEAAIGAATMGAGGIAARTVGKALVPAIGESVSVPAATKIIGASDVAAQIATMTTMPAALQGRLPDLQEIMDAAIVIGGLKGAHVAAERITSTFLKTGKTPAEQVADTQSGVTTPADFVGPPDRPTMTVDRNGTVFTGETAARATAAAENRLTELMVKTETEPLTDAERAERVFLTNNLKNPASLARFLGIEGSAHPPKVESDSAQRVYDDVLQQLRDVDQARIDTGRTPLGDDHALAVAALVKARVRTRAARLGLLPEDVYAERPLQFRDDAQIEAAAAEAPAGAPTFTPPEVDLFGNPVEVTNAPRYGVEGMATVETPLEGLVLSKEVPQFKKNANDEGVVVPLGGTFDRTGVGPIQVWERLDGTREVISGRHRLDLAKRSGETTIPAQIHREAEGFTARQAAVLDAMLNIREEQGSIADYVQYFKDSGITREAADLEGLLARAKGRTAFAIARDATDDLAAAHRAGLLSDEAALSISAAAPGSDRLQALGIAMVNEGKSALIAVNTMKAVELMAGDRLAAGAQGDIFGFDDSAMQEASAMAKKATSIQRKISEQISAVSGASRRPELARKMGVDVADPEGIQKRIVQLRQEQYLWDNWPIHPELVAQLRDKLKQGPPDVKSKEFLDWFGDSKVVDADGKPLVVYHGTKADIAEFFDTGKEKRAALSGLGHYFTADRALAERFSKRPGQNNSGVNIMPVYLSIKNPKLLEPYDWIARSASPESVIDDWRAEMEREGHDGVVVQPLKPDPTGELGTPQYVAFRSEQIKSAVGNRGTFDPNDPNILHQAETPAEGAARDAEATDATLRRLNQEREGIKGPLPTDKYPKIKQETARGSYDIAENLIEFMQNADRSTAVHELWHSWLEEMKADALRPDAPLQIKADWDILRRELAIPESGDISRASHEQLARSGERYLMEGEAPSRELRTIFDKFRAWLLAIYESVRNLNVEINPELKAVMDRMLATDAEIADARELDVPRAYVSEARAAAAEKIVPGPAAKKTPEPGFVDEQLAVEPLAEELLAGPGSGSTNDSRVNAKYINGPLDFKLAIQRVSELDQQNIQQHRGGTGGVKSWAEANAEVDRLAEETMGGKLTADVFPPGTSGAPPHDIQQRAAFRVMIAIAKHSMALRDSILEKGHDASVQDQFDHLSSIVRLRMAHAEFLGLRAASARALNQIKDMTPESGVISRMVEMTGGDRRLFQSGKTPAEEAASLKLKLDEIMAQHFSGRSALEIAKLQKDIKSLKGQLKLAKEVTDATKWEMVVEGWKAGLLSGPQTPVTNVVGTWSFQQLRAPIDALAAIIGMARGASPGMGESDRASMSEALARITGPLSGVQDGLKLAWAALKADEPTEKVESFRGAIPGRAGELVRIPFRFMSAGDLLTTTMYKRGELKTLAIRTAFDENLNPGTREFAERVQHLVDNPTEQMATEAEAAADRMSFNMPGGEKTVAVQSFVKNWGLQWMVPFIRTPINIAAEMIRMTPGAPLVADWRADIMKGGVARDRAIAEVVVGSGIMALTMAYAFDGQISGSGSPDAGKNRGKAGVWQPNSVLVGDKWYEIGRLQPGGTLMVLAADVAMAWDHMTPEEQDKVPKILAMAFSNAITNQTFLQGITNVVHMMSEPDRYGARFAQGLAASMVPNVIGQPTAMADPYMREVNSMLEAIQSRIPGMRQNLIPKKDWLGEAVATKERMGVVLPVRELEVSKDKVRLEAARLDISMAAPPKKTHIGAGTGKLGDVELTPEERAKFEEVGGKMAHEILTNIVAAPGYDTMPDIIKRRVFAKVLTAAHRVAAFQALPPDKRQGYLQEITEKLATELTAGN